jgi:alpha-L-fucosidase 2
MFKTFLLTIMAYLLFVSCEPATAEKLPGLKVDWPKFMASQDLVFEILPKKWADASIMGNGMMGSLVFQDSNSSLYLELGRSDYYDYRSVKNVSQVCRNQRLPIGYFMLNTVGKITDGSARLDLWNAETRGQIKTDKGEIKWRTYVHADLMLAVLDIETSAGEEKAELKWHPFQGISPRANKFKGTHREIKDYVPNPPQHVSRQDGIDISVQTLIGGGQCSTAWKEIKNGSNSRRLYISVEFTYPDEAATEKAVAVVKKAIGLTPEQMEQSHRVWWHSFYPRSFVSVPDAEFENVYWFQLYKLACATRSGRALADVTGPWLPEKTAWAAVWWNLNVQMSYWPALTANHPEIDAVLGEYLDKCKQQLINNLPEPQRQDSAFIERATAFDLRSSPYDKTKGSVEIGNLTWTMHNYYMHYRYTMDKDMLRNRIFPLLKRAINYYYYFLTEGADGKLHIAVKTISPEYPDMAEDCNYELGLVRWGCLTLLDICKVLDINDSLIPKWQDTLTRLTDYNIDENGYMVGKDVPFTKTHRHWSHMIMVYPLYLVNAEQPGSRELILKSLNHWRSLGKEWSIFSYVVASSIYSSLGDGNNALECLAEIRRPGKVYSLSSTYCYMEGCNPCIESPFGVVHSIQDMLIQSWGDKIRIFPAVPDVWKNVEFHNLRTEGAFLVSAKRQNSKTVWIRIKSLAGEPCRIKTDMAGDIKIAGMDKGKVEWKENDIAEINLEKGQEILLYMTVKIPDEPITGVSYSVGQGNFYGLHK